MASRICGDVVAEMATCFQVALRRWPWTIYGTSRLRATTSCCCLLPVASLPNGAGHLPRPGREPACSLSRTGWTRPKYLQRFSTTQSNAWLQQPTLWPLLRLKDCQMTMHSTALLSSSCPEHPGAAMRPCSRPSARAVRRHRTMWTAHQRLLQSSEVLRPSSGAMWSPVMAALTCQWLAAATFPQPSSVFAPDSDLTPWRWWMHLTTMIAC
mmetsp:Transcript_16982/g.48516  ORF Transcript_16982/g.48516 Transcript_16982/m.48516 type:complete len:211 (-) Transcript_16982:541-1173(-)